MPYQRLSNGNSADTGPQAITTVVNAMQAGLEDVEATLPSKAAVSHTHAQGDVTGLAASLAGKSDTSHLHTGVYDPAGSAAAAQAAAVQRANHTGTQAASTISDFNSAVRTNRLDQMAAPTGAVGMNGQRITGLGAPSASTDAVTKAYVDALPTVGGAARQTAGNRVAFAGDSIMRFPGDVSSSLNDGRSIVACWPTQACITSGQRALHVRNAAIGGDTSANLVSRFSADVLAHSPNVVVIGIGTNDLYYSILGTPSGHSMANWKANVATLVAATRSAGAVPVLCTLPPLDIGAAYKAAVPKWNGWIKRYAAAQGIPVIDVYRAVVDTTTGGWTANYGNPDNVHPTEYGNSFIAAEAKLTLDALLPRATPILTVDNTDAANMLTNGCMVTDAGADGIPDGWAWSGTGSPSLATDAGFCVGKYVRFGGSGVRSLSQTISSGFSVGDTVAVSGKIRTVSASPWTQEFSVSLTFTGSSGPVVIYPVQSYFGDVTGTFYQEFVIPASTTSLALALRSGSGSGTVDYAQVGLFNLTTMGA